MRFYRIIQHSKANAKRELKSLFFKKILHEKLQVEPIDNKSNNNFIYLSFLSKFGGFSRNKSFCFLSKKSRSVFSKFKLSRISFRECAHFGLINGVQKASW